jgi:menaquinol-cytochrome c reductase iron-sulfur subunit
MARSLKPSSGPSPLPIHPPNLVPETPRRNVLAAILASLIGAVAGLIPLGAGLLVFLDPILRARKPAAQEGQRPLRRVAATDVIPADGTPIQVPVIADLEDAWNLEPEQPVGAVYLRKVDDKVECFNAICPHAGCFVAYSAERKVFQCPCHTSSFELDGKRILPSPSPRDMDRLRVDEAKVAEGEVWVEFVNYYPGKETQEPKP